MRWSLALAAMVVSLLAAPNGATAGRKEAAGVPAPPSPPTVVNSMHPRFAVLDGSGVPVRQSGRPASSERTCGSCHDVDYINGHSAHWNERVKASCVACHCMGGVLPVTAASVDVDGKLRREFVRISSPEDANCSTCHGIIHSGSDPVAIPSDFESPLDPGRNYGFTTQTGSVFSPQDVSDSRLNLEAKSAREYPWDVHARRLVRCVDCHFARNNPMRKDLQQTQLEFLLKDPRRIALSEFLHRPDHRLSAATCRDCHDPLKTHEFLPYRERHLDALACESCHIPHPMAPAAQMIDATVVREDGAPAIVYRGMERSDSTSLNATYSVGYSPLLLMRSDASGTRRVGPANAVDRWFWKSDGSDEPVPMETVRRAYLDSGRYAPAVLAAFDQDHDGAVSIAELRMDSPAKRQLIRSRLQALGVMEPVIGHVVTLYPIHHGVLAGAMVQRDCNSCHADQSRLSAGLPLATYAVTGGPSATDVSIEGAMPGDGATLVADAGRSRIDARLMGESRFYVFGNSHRAWANRFGFVAFLAALVGTAVHGMLRVLHRKPLLTHATPRQRVYLYRVYERAWHWLMALSIIALMTTGLQIEFAGEKTLIPLLTAVRIHNFFAIVLTANAFLSLFYHLTAGAIRQFIPPREGLARQVAEQARYYAKGILLGQPHPSPKTAQRKLNPLQQLTYLALLNVLFPFQVITGTLIWGASRWPELASALGGLTIVAPLHDLGSWLFLAFFVLHLYLTTTGHTVLSHVGAMVHGYEELDAVNPGPSGGVHA